MEMELEPDIETPRNILPPPNYRTSSSVSDSDVMSCSSCATASSVVGGAVVGAVIGGFTATVLGVNNFLPVVAGAVVGAIGASSCTGQNEPSQPRPNLAERVRQRREQREANQQIASPDR
jgi:uncharacterized protein YcfJ